MKRSILLYSIIIIQIALTFHFSKRIVAILSSQERLDRARIQNSELKKNYLVRRQLADYVLTDLYVEEVLRSKFRHALPNEHIYLLNSNNDYSVPLPTFVPDSSTSKQKSNFEKWLDVFF